MSSTILAIQLNPFTPKIKISTLCTVLHTLPIILALRIWLQTKQHVYPQIYISSLLIFFFTLKNYQYFKEKFLFCQCPGSERVILLSVQTRFRVKEIITSLNVLMCFLCIVGGYATEEISCEHILLSCS